ncbi:hypothetical protein SASPL_126113 [Salvia splendens]|uniref:Protein RER1 n=1 Tax=Salvia splendens TaxID=180675 RepID=A0A8X8XIB2_SALSN|nr:hypothetical protein SASPL_126113 [Salvia splendens]
MTKSPMPSYNHQKRISKFEWFSKKSLKRNPSLQTDPNPLIFSSPKITQDFLSLSLLFLSRKGFYIVTYGLGIYLLNLLIGFLSPLVDPELEPSDGPSLPTKVTYLLGGIMYHDQKLQSSATSSLVGPFSYDLVLCCGQFWGMWYAITKAFCVAFLMTFFSMFDVPVFWPVLLCYWIVLLFLTMKRQIMHMVKYRYIPFNLGKQHVSPRNMERKSQLPAAAAPETELGLVCDLIGI